MPKGVGRPYNRRLKRDKDPRASIDIQVKEQDRIFGKALGSAGVSAPSLTKRERIKRGPKKK